MKKSTYQIRETKNAYHFSYSGDLQEAINKAERDLQRERDNSEIERWKWIQEKAAKAIDAHERKIRRIEAFIRRAREEVKRNEQVQ